MAESEVEAAARAAGRLSERQNAIAEGIAMIASGHSRSAAARETGIARSTLNAAYARILAASSDSQREQLDQEIISHAVIAANLAGLEINRRLADPAMIAAITTKELAVIGGISTDKVALKRRWARPEDAGSEDFLQAFAATASRVRKVTVELDDPAIDVTPEP